VHLGERSDEWSPRTVEYALNALDHLGAFAHPLGVRLLVENLLSEATSPEHLVHVLEVGHLNSVGACLDLGHAHITTGIPDAIATLTGRIASLHVHDNHGLKDEHLWPGEGNIDWTATAKSVNALPEPPAIVLELGSKAHAEPGDLSDRIRQAFERLG